MKKLLRQKVYFWLLLMIPVLTSCEINCPGFDQQIEIMSLRLFPEDKQQYDFVNFSGGSASILRFEKQKFEFSEPYKDYCSGFGPCDCTTRHETLYEFEDLQITNELWIGFEFEDPKSTIFRYGVIDFGNSVADGQNLTFTADNSEIQEAIDNIIQNEITIDGETFNNVLRLDLTNLNISLFVERNRGLQGILYQDEMYRVID
jgi:hypothetical protein